MIPVYEKEDGQWYFEDREGNEVGPFSTKGMATAAFVRQAGCSTGNCED